MHLRWNGIKNITQPYLTDQSALLPPNRSFVCPPSSASVPNNRQYYNHPQAQFPSSNGLQSSSLASLIRELTKIDPPGFAPQTTRSQFIAPLNCLHNQPPLQQQQPPVHNVLRTADPLYTLASLAEQERSLAESAHRVYMHQNCVGGSQHHHHLLLSTSLQRQQACVNNQLHQYRYVSPEFSCRSISSDAAAADLMAFSNHQHATKTLPMVDAQKTKKTRVTEPTSSNSNQNRTSLDQPSEDICMQRKVGRIRYFDEHLSRYGSWQDIFGGRVGDTENSTTITVNLSRGGTLRILCNILPQNRRKDISRAMLDCKLYRQYSLSKNDRLNFVGFQEPRSHVLLSSRAKSTFGDDEAFNDESNQPGYAYHGVQMKALPIHLVPEVASYAKEFARRYNLPHWDIGVDMIAYKDGLDSIGWHADDTQGESIISCVVVDAPGEIRPLYIRPSKRAKPLGHGDEEIQLFIAEGDGYDMDGYMQQSYEHSLPKKQKTNSHRFVLIFRHGETGFVQQDSGVSVLKNNNDGSSIGDDEWNVVSAITKLRPKTETVSFGHPTNVSVGECYSRRYLWTTFAHRSDQKGVNGNIKDGADSIVVSRQDFDVREEDGLDWLRYTSSRRQGGGSLQMSFRMKKPVRVFRSSNLKGSYRPAPLEGGRTSYRYDGLYVVTRVWNSEGKETEVDIPVSSVRGGVQFTFHLERLPQPDNIMTDDLFRKIQQSHIYGPHLPFTTPQPKNGGNILPALIQSMNQPLATAASAQQQSIQSTFQQPISINHGARIEIESSLSAISKEHFERTSKEVRKKEEEKKKTATRDKVRVGLPIDIVDAIFACILYNKSPPQINFKIMITEETKLSPPPFDYEGKMWCITMQ